MNKRIGYQVLNQMGGYLSKKPFLRAHWWSSRWIAYMTIHPPLTETDPLWKRSKNELRLLRLFNVRPEELGRKNRTLLEKAALATLVGLFWDEEKD